MMEIRTIIRMQKEDDFLNATFKAVTNIKIQFVNSVYSRRSIVSREILEQLQTLDLTGNNMQIPQDCYRRTVIEGKSSNN